MAQYWDMSECPSNCAGVLREQRFKAEKEDRPFCLICRCTIEKLKQCALSLDAHELTYKRAGFWLSSDISPLCRECHDFIEKLKPKPHSHCDSFVIVAVAVTFYPLMTQLLNQSGYLEDFHRKTGFNISAYDAFWVLFKDMFDRARARGDYDDLYRDVEARYGSDCKLQLQNVRTPVIPLIPSDSWSSPCLSFLEDKLNGK